MTFAEREEIAVGRAAGESTRAIASRLGRSPSTISRELTRNADRAGGYRATVQMLVGERKRVHAALLDQADRRSLLRQFTSS